MLWQNRGTVQTENTGKHLLADQQLKFEADENNRVFNVTRDHVPVMELELQPLLYLQRFPEIAAMLVQQ